MQPIPSGVEGLGDKSGTSIIPADMPSGISPPDQSTQTPVDPGQWLQPGQTFRDLVVKTGEIATDFSAFAVAQIADDPGLLEQFVGALAYSYSDAVDWVSRHYHLALRAAGSVAANAMIALYNQAHRAAGLPIGDQPFQRLNAAPLPWYIVQAMGAGLPIPPNWLGLPEYLVPAPVQQAIARGATRARVGGRMIRLDD